MREFIGRIDLTAFEEIKNEFDKDVSFMAEKNKFYLKLLLYLLIIYGPVSKCCDGTWTSKKGGTLENNEGNPKGSLLSTQQIRLASESKWTQQQHHQ